MIGYPWMEQVENRTEASGAQFLARAGAIDCALVIVMTRTARCQPFFMKHNYFAVASSSFLSIGPTSGLAMKFFHTRPVR